MAGVALVSAAAFCSRVRAPLRWFFCHGAAGWMPEAGLDGNCQCLPLFYPVKTTVLGPAALRPWMWASPPSPHSARLLACLVPVSSLGRQACRHVPSIAVSSHGCDPGPGERVKYASAGLPGEWFTLRAEAWPSRAAQGWLPPAGTTFAPAACSGEPRPGLSGTGSPAGCLTSWPVAPPIPAATFTPAIETARRRCCEDRDRSRAGPRLRRTLASPAADTTGEVRSFKERHQSLRSTLFRQGKICVNP